MTTNPYTPNEIAIIHAGRQAGKSYRELAALTGRSAKSIEVRLYRTNRIAPTVTRTFNARRVRNDRDITRIVAPMPAQCVLGQTVEVAGKMLVFISWNPSGEAVCMWERDVVVVSGS